MKSYIYANSQIIAQYDGDWRTPLDCKKFYLHDRLGSVRQVIDCQADVMAQYTYNPFGETIEQDSIFDNAFRFTGQWYDDEIQQYYLRARMYDPYLSRFTGRDPIFGKFEEPLTLHKYLYCNNNPINNWDPSGLLYTPYGRGHYNVGQTQRVIDNAVWYMSIMGLPGGLPAFGFQPNFWAGEKAWRGRYDYKNLGFSFEINSYGQTLKGSEFGNYIVGHALYYNFGIVGEMLGRAGGQFYAGINKDATWHGLAGDSGSGYEDWGSIFWITKGALDANKRAQAWYKDGFLKGELPPPSLFPLGKVSSGLLKIDEARLTYMSQLSEAFWINSWAFGE